VTAVVHSGKDPVPGGTTGIRGWVGPMTRSGRIREPESKNKLSAFHPVATTLTELYLLLVNVTQIDDVQWMAGMWMICSTIFVITVIELRLLCLLLHSRVQEVSCVLCSSLRLVCWPASRAVILMTRDIARALLTWISRMGYDVQTNQSNVQH